MISSTIMNDSQLDRLSEIMANFGLLLLASMVLPTIIGVDKADAFKLLLGMVGGVSFLLLSLLILKGVDR